MATEFIQTVFEVVETIVLFAIGGSLLTVLLILAVHLSDLWNRRQRRKSWERATREGEEFRSELTKAESQWPQKVIHREGKSSVGVKR